MVRKTKLIPQFGSCNEQRPIISRCPQYNFQAGIYWEELINYFSGWSLVLIGFAEVLVYGWVYGKLNESGKSVCSPILSHARFREKSILSIVFYAREVGVQETLQA